MTGEPARRYSWAPFTDGHTVSMRHGAWSKRRVDPVAAELVAGLLDDRPDLAAYPEMIAAWGRAQARCVLFDEYLIDLEPGSERADKVMRYVVQCERLAMEMTARLGLDPRAEAELTRDRAAATREVVDLAGIRERGRRALADREGVVDVGRD